MRKCCSILLGLSAALLCSGLCAQEAEPEPFPEEAEQVVVEVALEEGFNGNKAQGLEILSRYAQVECGLAHRACQLSPEQLAALKIMQQEPWLHQQLAQPDVGQVKVFKGIGRFLGGRVPGRQEREDEQRVRQDINRVKKLIDEGIAAILTEQQRSDFQREKDARDAFRREAMANVLLAVVDKQLYIDQEQWQTLVPEIEKWNKNLNLYWQFYFQNESYVPGIPEGVLRKALSREQLKAFRSLNSYIYEMDEVTAQMHGQLPQLKFQDFVP